MSRRATTAKPTYAERLGQVNGLLNTLADARLERVTRTARRLYGVRLAAVLLWRGNRLVYQVVDGAAPLDPACAVALEQEIARGGGPRLATGMRGLEALAFVAVAPLVWDRGLSVGCLVLLDDRPHALASDDVQSLGDLATWAEHELDVVHLGQTLALRMA